MAQGVIDVFEAIQVEKQYRSLSSVAARGGDRLTQSISQQYAIGQLGKRIVVGQIGHFERDRFGCAYVVKTMTTPAIIPERSWVGVVEVFDR
jgi:hypothetical protein